MDLSELLRSSTPPQKGGKASDQGATSPGLLSPEDGQDGDASPFASILDGLSKEGGAASAEMAGGKATPVKGPQKPSDAATTIPFPLPEAELALAPIATPAVAGEAPSAQATPSPSLPGAAPETVVLPENTATAATGRTLAPDSAVAPIAGAAEVRVTDRSGPVTATPEVPDAGQPRQLTPDIPAPVRAEAAGTEQSAARPAPSADVAPAQAVRPAAAEPLARTTPSADTGAPAANKVASEAPDPRGAVQLPEASRAPRSGTEFAGAQNQPGYQVRVTATARAESAEAAASRTVAPATPTGAAAAANIAAPAIAAATQAPQPRSPSPAAEPPVPVDSAEVKAADALANDAPDPALRRIDDPTPVLRSARAGGTTTFQPGLSGAQSVVAAAPSQVSAQPAGPTPAVPFDVGQVVTADRAVVTQVQQAIAARQVPGSIEVMLDPPELGRVEIVLELSERTLHATLTADRPLTGDMLRRHGAELLQQLNDAGFDDVDLSFSQRHSEAGGREATGRASGADGDGSEPAATPASAQRPRIAAGGTTGLDMRL